MYLGSYRKAQDKSSFSLPRRLEQAQQKTPKANQVDSRHFLPQQWTTIPNGASNGKPAVTKARMKRQVKQF